MAFFGLLLNFRPANLGKGKKNLQRELHSLQIVEHVSLIIQLQVGIALRNRQISQETETSSKVEEDALEGILVAMIIVMSLSTICKLEVRGVVLDGVHTFTNFLSSFRCAVSLLAQVCRAETEEEEGDRIGKGENRAAWRRVSLFPGWAYANRRAG